MILNSDATLFTYHWIFAPSGTQFAPFFFFLKLKKKKKKDSKVPSRKTRSWFLGPRPFFFQRTAVTVNAELAFDVGKQAHACKSTTCVVKRTRESQQYCSSVPRCTSVNRAAVLVCSALRCEGKRSRLQTQDRISLFLFCPSGPAKTIRSNKFRGGAVEFFFFFFTCFEGNFGI